MMSERHELEMKAEEIFNMVFAPLGWDPDDDDEAKDIVDRAVMTSSSASSLSRRPSSRRIPWRRAAPPMAWRYAMPTARDTARWMRSCSGIRTGLLKRLIIACRTGCRALCLTCLV